MILLGCFAAALAVQLIAFAVGVARGRHDGAGVAWGAGFAAVAATGHLITAGSGDPGMRALVTGLTVIWGLRLAAHLAYRGRGAIEDRRYADLMAKATGNPHLFALTRIYLAQAAVLFFVSLPVLAAQEAARLTPMAAIGVAFWLLGFVFETVGDGQLARFRADPASRGRVLDTGLWRYTRHPNYFGDACVWWGLFGLACLGRPGWFTLLSPILMTFLLARGTGKPVLERHLAERPGYPEYVARTSGFVPLPPHGR